MSGLYTLECGRYCDNWCKSMVKTARIPLTQEYRHLDRLAIGNHQHKQYKHLQGRLDFRASVRQLLSHSLLIAVPTARHRTYRERSRGFVNADESGIKNSGVSALDYSACRRRLPRTLKVGDELPSANLNKALGFRSLGYARSCTSNRCAYTRSEGAGGVAAR